MIASEAHQARIALDIRREDLAADLDLSPDVVTAWEEGRIPVPKRAAEYLTWRVAGAQRAKALATSGLPECDWVRTFKAQPASSKPSDRAAHLERLRKHSEGCSTCRAREAYLAERFPPMLPTPRPLWLRPIAFVVERVERLPTWARPAAKWALFFLSYTLIKILVSIPAIVREPRKEGSIALLAIIVSPTIGALMGLLHGQYLRLRARRSARHAA